MLLLLCFSVNILLWCVFSMSWIVCSFLQALFTAMDHLQKDLKFIAHEQKE